MLYKGMINLLTYSEEVDGRMRKAYDESCFAISSQVNATGKKGTKEGRRGREEVTKGGQIHE